MKRNLKFNLTSILCFITIMCAIFGMGLTVTNSMASANEQVTTFAMETGVNLKKTATGMRFKVKMDDQTAKNIQDNESVTLKFLIGPKVFFDAQTDGQYLNMSQKLTVSVDEAKIYTGIDGYKYANGCVYDMKSENLKIDYTAIAVIETADGEPQYATPAADNGTVRNMYSVVNSALVATEAEKMLEDEEVTEVLSTYSFMGTEDYPININTATEKQVVEQRAALFSGKTVKLADEVGFADSSVVIYMVGPNAEKAFDAEFVESSDSNVADYAGGKIISGGESGNATLTFKKVENGITYLQNVAVTVKVNPVVELAAEDIEVDNVALEGFYSNTKTATGTLYVDAVETSVSKIKWSLKSGEEIASITEAGIVTGLKAGSAVITASYTDDSGVTTAVDSNVTVNAPAYYGQHANYAHDGIVAEINRSSANLATVVFNNVTVPAVGSDNEQIIRLQNIPATNGSINNGPHLLQITLQDTGDLDNYIMICIRHASTKAVRTGVRLGSWDANYNYVREWLGLSNGTTANSSSLFKPTGYGGFYLESFSMIGGFATETEYENYMMGVSVDGTKVYLHTGGSKQLLWDLDANTATYSSSLAKWSGFTSDKVNVYVRCEYYNENVHTSNIMVDTLGGALINSANAANYIPTYVISKYDGCKYTGYENDYKGSPIPPEYMVANT